MRLDATIFRYITKEEFRVLSAVEMGMRNHELVPVPLIESIAKGARGSTYKILQSLLRNKLLAHDGKKYDGYRLTYHGYDFLALRALVVRGSVTAVGRRLGVGKESDVHFCQGAEGEVLALKLHRLGRISFRAIKAKRDYLQHREHASWMYMARLAAVKEFAYMKALKDEGFPVPTPVDQNRHAVVMSLIDAVPLFHLRSLRHPKQVLERLMRLLVRLARAGIVHGDFNEFNLMINGDEKVTLIDFPQIVHLNHANAEELFARDVRSIREFFRRRLNIEVEEFPQFHEVVAELVASGQQPALATAPAMDGVSAKEDALLVAAHAEDGDNDGKSGSEDEDESLADDKIEGAPEVFEQLHEFREAADEVEDGPEAVGELQGLGETRSAAVEGQAAKSGEAEGAPEVSEQLHEFREAADGVEDGPEAVGELQGLGEARSAAVEGQAAKSGGAEGKMEEAPQGELDGAGPTAAAAVADNSSDESEDSAGPGQVDLATGRRTRHRHTAKDARRHLQRQQRQRPAKANNQKVKEFRRAKHEINEMMY